MQQMYAIWLSLHNLSRQPDGGSLSQHATEERSIVMPTDYAEPMVGLRLFLTQKVQEEKWLQQTKI